MKISLSGADALAAELQRKSQVRFDAVCLKNITQIFNRAKEGGTPVDSGELRLSAGISKPGSSFGGEMGYLKEYAPHVEYGHRTLDGGFVQGQYYLKRNVDTQRPIFKQDLIEQLKRG